MTPLKKEELQPLVNGAQIKISVKLIASDEYLGIKVAKDDVFPVLFPKRVKCNQFFQRAIKMMTPNAMKKGRIFSSSVMAHASSADPAPKRVNMPSTIKNVVNIVDLPIFISFYFVPFREHLAKIF